ncbi:Crp/Fnr family transcriptional regulator [Parapedobacter deserti]|uniref:Crp/Fnr family transcriptional regulator n=1 Tax=Parapedobacter deserti TaxID=1912957 RepID=A0ABV7JIU4_9SPHI
MMEERQTVLARLRSFINNYYHLSDKAFQQLADLARIQELVKNEIVLPIGQVSKHVYYIHKGALIAFFTDESGNTYNKNIFLENRLAGSTVSALLKEPSGFTLQAIEDTTLLVFDYERYKELIYANDELKNFYIAYLEKNWVIEKEQREISIVMETAAVRYQKLLNEYPGIDTRIPLQHIASNLGITPTQLSRIRKALKKKYPNQHM